MPQINLFLMYFFILCLTKFLLHSFSLVFSPFMFIVVVGIVVFIAGILFCAFFCFVFIFYSCPFDCFFNDYFYSFSGYFVALVEIHFFFCEYNCGLAVFLTIKDIVLVSSDCNQLAARPTMALLKEILCESSEGLLMLLAFGLFFLPSPLPNTHLWPPTQISGGIGEMGELFFVNLCYIWL